MEWADKKQSMDNSESGQMPRRPHWLVGKCLAHAAAAAWQPGCAQCYL